MTPGTMWLTGIMAALLGNHLWQSAVLVPLALVLNVALRRHRAQLRYVLWLTASLKFLIPFAPLIAFGGWFASGRPALVPPPVRFVIDTVMQPWSWPDAHATLSTSSSTIQAATHLAITLLFLIWAGGVAVIVVTWGVLWRRVTRTVRQGTPLKGGREIDILRGVEQTIRVRRSTPLIEVHTNVEPGVFGIWRPVLLWPRSLGSRLTDPQIAAILAHELCHLRRRDNLVAACHMVVEALFWMHPLVWWLGARLLDERERACDEDVLRLGSDPHVYAEGLLHTCRFSLESPLPCVAGVTGSDLRARIARIVGNSPAEPMTGWTKSLLAVTAFLAFTAPIAVGVLNAPHVRAESAPTPTNSGASPLRSIRVNPSRATLSATESASRAFDITSITPNHSGDVSVHGVIASGDRYSVRNVTLKVLIQAAYGVQDDQIAGGPSWIDSERFDIAARPDRRGASNDQVPQMIRTLLAERFALRVHWSGQRGPVATLVVDGAQRPTRD